MISVSESIILAQPVAEVWTIAGPFEGLHVWHPAVTSTDMSVEDGVVQRRLNLDGGGALVENFDADNSNETTTAWRLVEGPFPVKNYCAWVSIAGEGSGCKVSWSAEFEAASVSDKEAEETIAGAFRAGLDELSTLVVGV